MPHKIVAAFLGSGELLPKMIDAVLDKAILPPENILLPGNEEELRERFEDSGATFFADEESAAIKAEFIVVCADKRHELGTSLARISGCTRGRIVIALCPNINTAYVTDRLVRGTEVISASLSRAEGEATYHAVLEFTRRILPYQVGPCSDLIASVCHLDDFAEI